MKHKSYFLILFHVIYKVFDLSEEKMKFKPSSLSAISKENSNKTVNTSRQADETLGRSKHRGESFATLPVGAWSESS